MYNSQTDGLGRRGKKKKEKEPEKKFKAAQVDTISEPVKLLGRFKNLVNKRIEVKRLLNFIKAMQKAIHERRIRKADAYAEEIEQAQRIAVSAYQRSKGKFTEVKVPGVFFARIKEISKSQKIRPSVAFLKRFVGLLGKPWHEIITPVQKLGKRLEFMYKKRLITKADPYIEKVQLAQGALKQAFGERDRIKIPSAALSGFKDIIAGKDETAFFSSPELKGFDYAGEDQWEQDNIPQIMTARQLSETVFVTLPFTGFYKKLLAEPERNFCLVVHGPPFQGKTTFCVAFAKYLADNFGNVCYITTEQYRSKSLQDVVKRVGAGAITQIHFVPSLEQAGRLENYDFIFIDSATADSISLEQVLALKEQYPQKAFIIVLQSIKSGDFCGKQGWRHMADIFVKVEEGKARLEKNRFAARQMAVLPLPKQAGDEKKNPKKKIRRKADAFESFQFLVFKKAQ